MTVIAMIVVILLLAVLLERTVEAVFAPLFDHIPILTPHKWSQFYIAVVLGMVGALL